MHAHFLHNNNNNNKTILTKKNMWFVLDEKYRKKINQKNEMNVNWINSCARMHHTRKIERERAKKNLTRSYWVCAEFSCILFTCFSSLHAHCLSFVCLLFLSHYSLAALRFNTHSLSVYLQLESMYVQYTCVELARARHFVRICLVSLFGTGRVEGECVYQRRRNREWERRYEW